MNREQVKDWHAQRAQPQEEQEDGEQPGPNIFDVSTPDPEVKVKDQIARIEDAASGERTHEEAGIEETRRIAPEDPPTTMGTPTGDVSGLCTPHGDVGQLEGTRHMTDKELVHQHMQHVQQQATAEAAAFAASQTAAAAEAQAAAQAAAEAETRQNYGTRTQMSDEEEPGDNATRVSSSEEGEDKAKPGIKIFDNVPTVKC